MILRAFIVYVSYHVLQQHLRNVEKLLSKLPQIDLVVTVRRKLTKIISAQFETIMEVSLD